MEKRKHIWAMLLFVVSCLFSTNAFAYDALIDGIYYNFYGDKAEVVEVGSVFSGDIIIPESVIYHEQTYSVTSIGNYAFKYCDGLTSVTIGSGVLSIGISAFTSSPKKVIWLTNTPPNGYTNLQGSINYVANNLYTSLKNVTVYPYLSSLFEVTPKSWTD